jgi:hypothetical protein
MSKPKLTWANFKRDKWLLFQIAIVVTVAIVYILLSK